MSLPEPEEGLVIRYGYLWHSEFLQGREQGAKDRPCAIIVAIRTEPTDRFRVFVLPITHSPPNAADEAIEIPLNVKRRLDLDHERSWIVLTEWNEFYWPSPDLARISSEQNAPICYGVLPPAFGNHVRQSFAGLVRQRRAKRIIRTE